MKDQLKTKQIIGLFFYLGILLAYSCYLVIQAIETVQR